MNQDIPLELEGLSFPSTQQGKVSMSATSRAQDPPNRRRSNSQSQVMHSSSIKLKEHQPSDKDSTKEFMKQRPKKRNLNEYYVILTSLNDTFDEKHLKVPYHPDVIKLGRPAATKTKPDVTNGFFDSRVLSRNHAAMFYDPISDKIMIQDCGSSNGTYVNDNKITDVPVPIDVGDTIHLGFHIQVESTHKPISAKVKNINVLSNFFDSSHKDDPALPALGKLRSEFSNLDSFDFKHYDFIQDIITQMPKENNDKRNKRKQEPVSFDNALFGDISPNLEDTLLGLNNKGSTGIFNNSQITNASGLESTISLLTVNLAKVKQQNNTLKSLESFVSNYQARLNELNSKYLSGEMEKFSNTYRQKLAQEQSVKEEISKINEELQKANQKLSLDSSLLQAERSTADQKMKQLELENSSLLEKMKELERRNEANSKKLTTNGIMGPITTTSTSNIHATADRGDKDKVQTKESSDFMKFDLVSTPSSSKSAETAEITQPEYENGTVTEHKIEDERYKERPVASPKKDRQHNLELTPPNSEEEDEDEKHLMNNDQEKDHMTTNVTLAEEQDKNAKLGITKKQVLDLYNTLGNSKSMTCLSVTLVIVGYVYHRLSG